MTGDAGNALAFAVAPIGLEHALFTAGTIVLLALARHALRGRPPHPTRGGDRRADPRRVRCPERHRPGLEDRPGGNPHAEVEAAARAIEELLDRLHGGADDFTVVVGKASGALEALDLGPRPLIAEPGKKPHEISRRDEITVPKDMDKAEVEKLALADEAVQKALAGGQPKKVIVVPGKIVNIVG